MEEKRALVFVVVLLIICFVATTCLAGIWLDENVEFTIEAKHYVQRELVDRPHIVYIPSEQLKGSPEVRVETVYEVVNSVEREQWDRQETLDRANLLVMNN